MAKAYLSGGPCNGRTVNLTVAEADAGELTCRGGLYKNPFTGAHHHGAIVFDYAGPAPPPGGGGGGGSPASVGPQAYTGWNALRRSFNRELPAAVHAIARNQAAALRELGHGRKVRR
jgi:hypothetical protein